MKQGIFKFTTALAGVAVVGGGVTLYVAAPGGGEEEVISQVGVPTPGVASPVDCVPAGIPLPSPTPIDPSAPKFVPINPDAGLSDSERFALYEQARQAFKLNYAAWVECVGTVLDTIDLRSVPTYDMNISFGPGQPNLRDAMTKAELIVVGNIIALSPTRAGGTLTTLAVEQTLKGASVSTVTYMQGSQISPTEDWTGVTVSEAPNEGLLVPGDRAVLFLQHNAELGWYQIRHITGWFRIIDGLVKPNYFNDWRGEVEAKTEAQFIDAIRAGLN